MIEQIKPMDIEKRSFEIITELLGERKLDPETSWSSSGSSIPPRILTMRTIWCFPLTPYKRESKLSAAAVTL